MKEIVECNELNLDFINVNINDYGLIINEFRNVDNWVKMYFYLILIFVFSRLFNSYIEIKYY